MTSEPTTNGTFFFWRCSKDRMLSFSSVFSLCSCWFFFLLLSSRRRNCRNNKRKKRIKMRTREANRRNQENSREQSYFSLPSRIPIDHFDDRIQFGFDLSISLNSSSRKMFTNRMGQIFINNRSSLSTLVFEEKNQIEEILEMIR